MVYRVAVKTFLITGSVGALLMFVVSFFYTRMINVPGALYSMLVMSPTIFFCCLVSAHRGLYEGTRNMAPTAVSQVIEAVGKLVLGLTAAYGALLYGRWQFSQGSPYSAPWPPTPPKRTCCRILLWRREPCWG